MIEPLHLLRYPARRVGIVRIAAHDDAAARVAKRQVQARRYALFLALDDADPCITHRLDLGPGVVGRAVVDDDDFHGHQRFSQDRSQCRLDKLLSVQHWNKHAHHRSIAAHGHCAHRRASNALQSPK